MNLIKRYCFIGAVLLSLLDFFAVVKGQQGIWPGIVEGKEKKCVMYDVCTDKLPDGRELLCYVEHGPKPLDPVSLQSLRTFCPEMIDMYDTNELCCHPNQIVDLVTQLATPQSIIAHCPSCWYNFRQNLCELTCSPYQTHFIQVNKFYENNSTTGQRIIEDLDFYMTERYAQETFDSCKDVVIFGSNNTLALDFLCGGWGADRCTPQRWYEFMGSALNGYAPFNIFYTLTNSTATNSTSAAVLPYQTMELTPYDGDTYKCNKAPSGVRTCSCKDCVLNCPIGNSSYSHT